MENTNQSTDIKAEFCNDAELSNDAELIQREEAEYRKLKKRVLRVALIAALFPLPWLLIETVYTFYILPLICK